MKCTIRNPWQQQGVSVIPEDLTCIMPLVGQEKLFGRLQRYIEDILNQGGTGLAGFFTLFGGWGVGKSRVGHEICLESLSGEVAWIVEGNPQRLLETNLKQRILPLFVRYVQVTKGVYGDQLEANNWIACVVTEALAKLAGLRERSTAMSLAKNQDQLMKMTVNLLRPKGWDSELSNLQAALNTSDPFRAANDGLDILKRLGIDHILLVVDEIEDITDVEKDGLPSDEREGIDQALLTVIPRVIKEEEIRQEFPQVNFILLCSQAVGDLLKQIRAIERRTGWHELTTNSFADIEAFFQFLAEHRPSVGEAIAKYPQGLKETTFFAANRNFGWFNVIMHHAHENLRDREIPTADLLWKYAQTSATGTGKSVFNLDTVSHYRIPDDEDYKEVVRSMFDLLPKSIGEGGISHEKASRFLEMRDQGGSKGPLFIRIQEVNPPQKHRILSHLVSCGFSNPTGTELMLPGEVRFDLQIVLDSLSAYSIGLPKEQRNHYLICEDENEFVSQISGLSPYSEQADRFAKLLHGLLMDPDYRTGTQYIAPSFSFLLDFNQLTRSRKSEEGFLKDHAKNTKLEEAYLAIQKDQKTRAMALLQGIANAWDMENAPLALSPLPKIKLAGGKTVTRLSPLSLGQNNEVFLLFAGGSAIADIEHDLQSLARNSASPVLVVLEDQEKIVDELKERLERNVPAIYPFIILHNLTHQMAGYIIRLGLLGEIYSRDELRTSHFHSVIGVAKEHLKKDLELWKQLQIEDQGYLLEPMFYGSRVTQDEFCSFAKGYAALLEGHSYHDIVQTGSVSFANDMERDQFKKLENRHTDPSPQYSEYPHAEIIIDNEGIKQAVVPRAFLSILKSFGPVPLKETDIERHFLFEMPEGHKSRDVMRHYLLLLQCFGLLDQSDDKLVRTSKHQLETWLNRARGWLDGELAKKVDQIKKVSHDTGEDLNRLAKEAKSQLKEAEKRLDGLSLDFINKPWDELNTDTSEDIQLYEQEFRNALAAVRFVRNNISRVYDPEGLASFRYNSASLQELDEKGASSAYHLWKRVAVLTGFFEELDTKRKDLIRSIDSTLAEVESRVPDLSDGQKAFPTQPLTLPLSLFRQELSFSADKPERTIMAGGTTMGINTVGFKLASGRFNDALERVEIIENELDRSQPNKLVAGYFELLKSWEGMRNESDILKNNLDALLSFFSDASDEIKNRYQLPDLVASQEEIHYQINEGGIREGTDNREAAGTPAHQLLDGLKDDLKKLQGQPAQVNNQVTETDQRILTGLRDDFSEKYKAQLSAIARIRVVSEKQPLMLPEKRETTYGKTVTAFEKITQEMLEEGKAFFADEKETTFDIFVGFCKMDQDNKPIDWNSSEFERHVDALRRKKLLILRLV